MDKLKLTGALFLSSALLISGCGNSNKDADKANREDATIIHDKEKEGGSLETGDGYGFSSFDLEIDVDGKDAVDAEYEVEKNVEAEYENKLTNEKLKDSAALNALDKLFVAIMITNETAEQDIKEKILEYYQIDNYSKFDLDVKFDDGTTLAIEDVK